MTKEEFKEMFEECFVLEAKKDYDGYVMIRICDKEMFYSGPDSKRKSGILEDSFYIGD